MLGGGAGTWSGSKTATSRKAPRSRPNISRWGAVHGRAYIPSHALGGNFFRRWMDGLVRKEAQNILFLHEADLG